jgi:hypothetical protein
MKTIIAAAAALGGLMSMGLGVATADTIQVEGNYATLEACQADGPNVEITQNNGAYSQWNCQQGDDGLYYLFLSS